MKQYLDVLRDILKTGDDRIDRTGVGTRAKFGYAMRFPMRDGFPAMTTKELKFDLVKAELLWFLTGSSDVRELHKLGCHIWDAQANASYWKPKARFEGDIGRAYGPQWRSWQRPDGTTLDQIEQVVAQIKKDPADRRMLVVAYNPGEVDETALPACHALFQFFVAKGQLSLQMYQRSCDMILGVPFNIASYALLLHMVAQVTELKTGEFIHILGDAHIYRNHIEQTREQLLRVPYRLPTLWLNPDIQNINGFTMDDIRLKDYQHHLPIRAKMAV